MRVLVINCGSSTLKFDLLGPDRSGHTPDAGQRLARGVVDRIGQRGEARFSAPGQPDLAESGQVADHRIALQRALAWLEDRGLRQGADLAVGHRVVHGGDRFSLPARIDREVLESIAAVTQLAPLHNGPALAAIHAAREILGEDTPMVAVFDTAFHRTMPEVAARYAIPGDLAEKHRVWRYGFHGLAHQYLAERCAALLDRPLSELRLITLQLGNGCSAAAIAGGRSVDTTMGLTPLEGLMMGTRSGDVDPSLAGFLAQREGVSPTDAEGWLNTRSGLLGVSGRTSDMRELLRAEAEGNRRCSLAVDMFCYRVRKCIGAYLAVLGGADAVAFGGGIGENAPAVRGRSCAGLEWCGLRLDPDSNRAAVGREARISARGSGVAAFAVPVDEAAIIARDTVRCLQDATGQSPSE